MNSANKLRWANILTALASIIAIVQTFLVNPPFTDHAIYVWGAVLTYATLIATTWKQYLSPEISNTGARVTIAIAIAATLTGFLDLVHVFTFSPEKSQWIKWGVTVLIAILNILSKQIFPSLMQKDNMRELKTKQ